MAERDLLQANAQKLSGLLQIDRAALWSERDLAAMLEHQLDTPLVSDLGRLNDISAGSTDARSRAEGPPIRTFRELFEHPGPPVELLELTKRFAKSARGQPDGALPDEVVTVLYLAAIVTARLKCGHAISRLDDAALAHALDWALAQTWLVSAMRELFGRVRATLTTSQQDDDA